MGPCDWEKLVHGLGLSMLKLVQPLDQVLGLGVMLQGLC